MKPCRRYRKLLALSAASALSEREQRAAVEHLRKCSACRDYEQELASICAHHEEAGMHLQIAAPTEEFYDALLSRVQREESCRMTDVRSWNGYWKPGLVWAFAVAVLLGVLGVLPSKRAGKVTENISRVAVDLPEPGPRSESKYISYRLALNRSFEDLDRLLSQAALHHDFSPSTASLSREALADPGLDF